MTEKQLPSPPQLPPPPPPPLPPTRAPSKTTIALKTRAEPPKGTGTGHSSSPSQYKPTTSPAGTYFFYGTLQDPHLLREILDIPNTPTLTPAYITGYALRLWGQYPALTDASDGVVEGMAFDVQNQALAARLAMYETGNYRPESCWMQLRGSEQRREGFVFKYCGNEDDLTDGMFDLGVWLKRMGRGFDAEIRDAGL